MHFKNLKDLTDDISEWIPDIADQFDCIVGIPRSGMLVANIMALKLSLPCTDLDSFLEGKIYGMGKRFKNISANNFLKENKKILIIDDSVSSGYALREAKNKIDNIFCYHSLTYGAVYVTPKSAKLVDIYFSVISNPRRFEWNILESYDVSNYAFDMDGVLCVDPNKYENDDGQRYIEFIRNAKPLYIPKYKIKLIVTSRLEKYRNETEEWLKKNNVKYEHLYMLDLPSKKDRLRLQAGAQFKSEIYKKSSAILFIESSYYEALSVCMKSKKIVYSIENAEMIYPNKVYAVKEHIRMKMIKNIKKSFRYVKYRISKFI